MKKYVKIIIIALVFACIMTVNVSAFDTANESSLVINASELSADINDALELAKSTYSQNIARSGMPLVPIKKIYTTGNKELELFYNPNLITPEEAVEAEDDFRTYEYLDFELLDPDNPEYTNTYNCHYYAWCMDWDGGRHWLNDVTPLVNDKHTYSFKNESEVQVGDKVTYKVNGKLEHSAIVHEIRDGEIYCRSKWGRMGIYVHRLDQVPSTYIEYDENGDLNVKFHRYVHGEHYYGWYSINDDQHAWKCRGCTAYTAGTAVSHTNSATGTYTESGHSVYCSGCGYSGTEEHNIYIYQDNGESGVTIKCNQCDYMRTCYLGVAEYGYANENEHYVGCTCGCYNFLAPHRILLVSSTGSLYTHQEYCGDCGTHYQAAHSWVAKNYGNVQGYECLMCNMFSISIPGIMQIPPDDELLLGSSDDIITDDALLPGKEDDLVTE